VLRARKTKACSFFGAESSRVLKAGVEKNDEAPRGFMDPNVRLIRYTLL